MAYKTIANYGSESPVEIPCRAKDLRGARATAIRWLRDNGTYLDAVMVLSNGHVIGRVYLTPRKYLNKHKNKVAVYLWADPINGIVPIDIHGRPRTFIKH